MLYRSWERFTEACEDLCVTGQKQTRACLRWRQQANLLVIRVTDDRKTLTFKARSSVYLNRFEVLNRTILTRYQYRRRVTATAAAVAPTGGEGQTGAAEASTVQDRTEGAAGQAESGAAKKKKKKGKKAAK
ncbi:hypothetical protein JCM10213_008609 [Rhodosporidiobolus nylandii]